jgi:hypothetical protein
VFAEIVGCHLFIRMRHELTALSERRTMIEDITQARTQGARLEPACEVVGISLRTYRLLPAGR